MDDVADVFDAEGFVELLGKLVGEARHLQNGPPDLVPKEDRANRHVLAKLTPYAEESGGPLRVRHVSFVEGRGNVVVEYPGTEPGDVMSFVGCHLDVVPANPETWQRDPFALTVEGDELHGRGTTDCLGHVALLTELFVALGKRRPKLRRTVFGVWIANEENSRALGVGIDELVKRGELDALKAGPLFWVDVADKTPCIGTGGCAAWHLRATGKLFHSGMPQNSINPIELASEALAKIQARFYQDFPPHAREAEYGFKSPSTMKPTQVAYPGGSVNQIPGEVTISGDIRVTPFYDIKEVMRAIDGYVAEINADIEALPTRGPVSKYALPAEGLRGRLELTWGESASPGLACDLESDGFHALVESFESVTGRPCEPIAITGTLPCIKDLQDEGYDVQTCGFGLMKTYHANNEHALLSDFRLGYDVFRHLISLLDDPGWAPKKPAAKKQRR